MITRLQFNKNITDNTSTVQQEHYW